MPLEGNGGLHLRENLDGDSKGSLIFEVGRRCFCFYVSAATGRSCGWEIRQVGSQETTFRFCVRGTYTRVVLIDNCSEER